MQAPPFLLSNRVGSNKTSDKHGVRLYYIVCLVFPPSPGTNLRFCFRTNPCLLFEMVVRGKSVTKKGISSKIEKPKTRKKKRIESYSRYIFKVLKQVQASMGISSMAMSIVNSFLYDIFERIASEASRLVSFKNKKTLTSREIHTAVRLILPGALSLHAISEGTKAVNNYNSS